MTMLGASIRGGFFAVLLLATVTAFGGPASAGSDGGIEAGKRLAENLCARCHAIGLEGASPNAEAPPFRSFHGKWPLENLAEALAEGIAVGHPDMPAFELYPEQIEDLIAYLYTLE
jgi:mono/diheme cytochrome c family protein